MSLPPHEFESEGPLVPATAGLLRAAVARLWGNAAPVPKPRETQPHASAGDVLLCGGKVEAKRKY